MNTTTQAFHYFGHKAKRKDGQERRQKILEATLRLIAQNGLRGVKHRAIAKEAGVSLSATTYYFKDIKDLISDAFTLFAEKTVLANEKLKQKSFEALDNFKSSDSNIMEEKLKFANLLKTFLLEHIESQVTDKDSRLIERIFRLEALREPRLAELQYASQKDALITLENFLKHAEIDGSEALAQQFFSLIMHLEYCLLLNMSRGEEINHHWLENQLEKFVEQLLDLK